MPQLLLTDIAIRALKPAGTRTDFWDTKTPGFGVRVGSRSKAFFAKHKNRWHTLGSYPDLSLADARAKAKQLMASPPPASATLTFQQAYDLFLSNHCANIRASTKHEYKNTLNRHFLNRWRNKRLSDIDTEQVVSIVGDLSGTPAEAFHAFAVARTFFAWGVSLRYIKLSPLYGVRGPRPGASRTRVLSRPELIAAYRAARSVEAGTFGKFIALLILTGQRKNQIVCLHTAFIDRENKTITWPAEAMKGRREHTIPYGDTVDAILAELPKAGLLFPSEDRTKPMGGFTKRKGEFDKLTSFASYTFHDLRRTMRSGLASIGVPPHIGERILDHRSGAASDVEAIYDRYRYSDEMRQAMENWERHLSTLL
jgi:integrase